MPDSSPSHRETAIWCALASVGAVGASAAGGAATVAALPVVGVATVAAVATNIASNKIDSVLTKFRERRLSRIDAGRALDSNHDEARAIREAQLEALRELVERYRAFAKTFDQRHRADLDYAVAAARWVAKEAGSCLTLEVRHDEETEAKVRAAVDSALAAQSGLARPGAAVDGGDVLRAAAEQAVLDELKAAVGREPPADFIDWFRHRDTGWFAGFVVQMSAKLKRHADLAALWTAMRLAWTGEQLGEISSQVSVLHEIAARIDLAHWGQPVVPIYLPALNRVSAQDRFSFKNPDIPFLGRERELAELDAFLDSPSMFSWHLVTGGGGAGKSRLALELCLRRNGPWRVGFVRDPDSAMPAVNWLPQKPHLLVIDYAQTHGVLTTALLAALSAPAEPLTAKVRVLLIDRSGAAEVESQTWTQSHLRQEIRAARWKPSALALGPQPDDDLWRLTEAFRGASQIARAEFLEEHATIDSERRTLTALILAEAHGRGVKSVESLTALLDELLIHERNVWSAPIVGADAEDDLLAYATMIDGFVPARDGARIPDNVRAKFAAHPEAVERLAAISPPQQGSKAVIGRYLPDLVGEFFALRVLERQARPDPITGAVARPWLIGAAWRSGEGREMSDFVSRVRRDFPELFVSLRLDEPDPEAPFSFFTRAVHVFEDTIEAGGEQAVDAAFDALPDDDSVDYAGMRAGVFLAITALRASVGYERLSRELRRIAAAASSAPMGRLPITWAACVANFAADFADRDPAFIEQQLLALDEWRVGDAHINRLWAIALVHVVGAYAKTDRQQALFGLRQIGEALAEDEQAGVRMAWAVAITKIVEDGPLEDARHVFRDLDAFADGGRIEDPAMAEAWAAGAAAIVARTAQPFPQSARETLDAIEALAAGEFGSPGIMEAWIHAAGAVLSAELSRTRSLAGEQRALWQRITVVGDEAGALIEHRRQWMDAGFKAVTALSEHSAAGAAEVLDQLEARALEAGADTEVVDLWAKAASNFIADVARTDAALAKKRLAALSARLIPSNHASYIERWTRAAAHFVRWTSEFSPEEAWPVLRDLERHARAHGVPRDILGDWGKSITNVIAGKEGDLTRNEDLLAVFEEIDAQHPNEPEWLSQWSKSAAAFIKGCIVHDDFPRAAAYYAEARDLWLVRDRQALAEGWSAAARGLIYIVKFAGVLPRKEWVDDATLLGGQPNLASRKSRRLERKRAKR